MSHELIFTGLPLGIRHKNLGDHQERSNMCSITSWKTPSFAEKAFNNITLIHIEFIVVERLLGPCKAGFIPSLEVLLFSVSLQVSWN